MIEEDEATRIANPGPGARYELLAPIASGGMATVYVGRQFGAGGFQRIVAVKRMHPHIAESAELTAMFRDEARIASLIHHPNVVAILDVYEASGEQLLVMDYVEGVSLGQLRKELRVRGTAFPTPIALRIMVDSLRGLHAAHEQKDMDGVPLEVVHRDATPQNILLGVDGCVKVTDFGIARAAERSAVTSAGQAKGKFAYMAPEQCAGGVMDRRVDVFAMGIVLWELLVGKPMFRGENDAIIISQITSGKYPRPMEVRPGIPKRLDGLVMKAISMDPAERYATAAAFADAIEGYAPDVGGLAASEEIGRLVMAVCGDKVQKRRHHVHEVIGGRKPKVAWGAPPAATVGSGSHGYASFPSASVSTHHAPVGIDDSLEPVPDFRSRPSAVRLAIWVGGGVVAALIAVVAFVALFPASETAPPSLSALPPPSGGAETLENERVDVRIEADREITEIRVPEGNDVEIAGRTATFTAARGHQPVVLTVKFDDGSELAESVVPTANAVIKVRSATAVVPSATVVPKATSKPTVGKPPAGKGPRFVENPYE
jgi:serine/threonine-protein kinase